MRIDVNVVCILDIPRSKEPSQLSIAITVGSSQPSLTSHYSLADGLLRFSLWAIVQLKPNIDKKLK